MPRALLGAVLSLSLPLTLTAADWPQFLGPNRDNTTPEKVAPWKGDLTPAWKAPVGDAHSSPVVANGVVYAFYQPQGKNADALAAFDAKTGQRLWEKSYDRAEFKPLFGAGPRSTPTVADGKVYTLGGTGVLACWDAKTGDIAWRVDTLKEFNAPNLFFGVSTSPLVEGNTVVVLVGGKGAGVVAFDRATGKPAWKATDDPASYASPIAVGTGTDRQLIFLTGSHLRGLSPEGKELWAYPFKDRLNESSTTPVKVGDTVVGSSVTAGSVALKVTGQGGKWAAERVWLNPDLTCYFSTPVVVGKHLYMVNGAATLTNPTITLRCVELGTGKVTWERKNVGRYHAAIVRTADDHLLMLDDRGELILFAADPAAYKELARSKVCGPTWAHPAVADGTVYLRDEKELLCIPLGSSPRPGG
jgi:outer membrane protein assembly factor BamB